MFVVYNFFLMFFLIDVRVGVKCEVQVLVFHTKEYAYKVKETWKASYGPYLVATNHDP